MPDDSVAKCQDYLELFKVENNKYLIGVFQTGITFYKQQIRALNIFYALMKTKVLKKPSGTERMTICVVGGGIAGLTFTAAALKTGFEVHIIEKEEMLLYMQHGCETRKIHPTVYDWPDDHALLPDARIPVLSWRYDTASRVADQVRSKFREIAKQSEFYHEHTNSVLIQLTASGSKIRVVYKEKSKDAQVPIEADLLIYAPGYGIEHGVNGKGCKTPSYWRNDDFGQPFVSDKVDQQKRFGISGTGDGALMDLFRVKIRDFDLDDLFRVIKSDMIKYDRLKSFLDNLKKNWVEAFEKKSENILPSEFRQMHKNNRDVYEYIVNNYIKPRLVRNKTVELLGAKGCFEDNLSLKSVSLLNAFLAYILLVEVSGFNYKQKKNRNKPLGRYDQKIERHGTDRKAALKPFSFDSATITRLKRFQEERLLYANAVQLWKYADLFSYFNSVSDNERFEYFRPETVSICSSFISILFKIFGRKSRKSDTTVSYGLTLYRLISVDNKLCYQQVTPYYNNTRIPSKRSIGSYFNADTGSIGYTFKTGEPLMVKTKDATDKRLDDVKMFFNHTSNFMIQNRNTFLTIPILSKLSNTSQLATNLVLYVDTNSDTLFNELDTFEDIVTVIEGFVEALKNILKLNQIYMGELTFAPSPVQNVDLESLPKDIVIDIAQSYTCLKTIKTQSIFDHFHSFDIIFNDPSMFKEISN